MKQVKPRPKRTTVKKGKERTAPGTVKKAGKGHGDLRTIVELLQINQIELEHQNEELRIAEEELEISRNKYVDLFDFSPLPYLALDPKGTITQVNLNGAMMLGADRSRLMGRSFLSYIIHNDKSTFISFLRTVFSGSQKRSCTVNVVNKDKKVFHVLVEGVAQEALPGSERRCQIALIDRTEFKSLEDAYERLSAELSSLKSRAKNS